MTDRSASSCLAGVETLWFIWVVPAHNGTGRCLPGTGCRAPLGDALGNVVAVSVMWVKMPSAGEAGELKKLEDTYGTGDVTPFATEALQLGGIKFTGRHYASRSNGSMVVIAESEGIRGQASATLLNDVAKIAVVLPRPTASR